MSAVVEIRDDFGMIGVKIYTIESILVGNKVNIGTTCMISNTYFHLLDPVSVSSPQTAKTAAINLEDETTLE